MKKYLALLLVLVMVLSLAACASKPAETTDEPEQTTTEPAPAEETKDEEPAPAEETKEEEPTEEPADNTEYAVAMITDYGDITDQSFNQTTYEACKEFCEANGLHYVPPYNLRHTFVSLAKTLPEGQVKPLVGHSRQMDTFGIYAHLIHGEDVQTAADLDNVLSRILDPENLER